MIQPQANISQEQEQIFAFFDQNSSGVLQREEFIEFVAANLNTNPQNISPEQLDYHFNLINRSRNNGITFKDYYEHFFGQNSLIPYTAPPAIPSEKTVEGDEDELIDLMEFTKLISDAFLPLGVPVSQESIEWNFGQIDIDNSGRITFDEYMDFIAKHNK